MHATAKTASLRKSSSASRSNAGAVQTRLSVGQSNDHYEQEADRVADTLVNTREVNTTKVNTTEHSSSSAKAGNSIQRSNISPITSTRSIPKISRLADTQPQRQEQEEVQTRLQKQEEEEEVQTKLQLQADDKDEPQTKLQCQEEEEVQTRLQKKEQEEEEAQTKLQRQSEEEEEPVQAKKEARANIRDKRQFPVLNKVEKKLFEKKGQGEKLDDETRTSMEVGMGADFRDVKVHKDADAVNMNRELRAQAFTHGKDVFFNSGKFAPETGQGKQLLAHELTHVVQQGAAEQKTSEERIDKNNSTRLQPPPEPLDKQALETEQQTQVKIQENKPLADAKEGVSSAVATTDKQLEKTDTVVSLEAAEKETEQEEAPEAAKKKSAVKKTAVKKTGKASKKQAKKKGGSGAANIGQYLKKVTQVKFTAKKNKISKLARNEKQKESPENKLKQTEKSVVAPAQEGQSRANASQVKTVEASEAPQPDEREARQQLDDKLQHAVPTSLEEVDEFKEEGKGRVVGEAVKGVVTADTQEVQSTYQKIENTPEAQTAEQAENLPEVEIAVETPVINMGEGVVGEVLPEHTDMSDFEAESDNQMQDEGITEEQLEMVDEGELAEAKAERKNVKSKVKDGPAEVRQFEQKQKQNVNKDLQKEEQANKQNMRAKRQQTLLGAKEDQQKTKSKIELQRQKVTDHINDIYEKANTTVKQKLEALEKQALKAFDEGEKQATKDFENNVDCRINAFKSRRYDRFGGSLLWAKDKLFGMDELPEVKQIFDSEKNAFITRIDALIKKISAENKRVIQECKDLVAAARKQIEKFVAGLGPELQKTGQSALTDIKAKLDALDKTINNKEKELKKKLQAKREAAIKAIEEKIEKMKEEMSGLISKLGNLLLNAMIKFFKWALKKAGYASEKLMGIINKGKTVIKKIVTDPIAFIGNIISAVKNGIGLFQKNIKKHLVSGLIGWLTGAMSDLPIQLPAQFDLKGIFSLVLQILGLTWQRIRTKLVKRMGERVVKIAETSVDLVKKLIIEGPIALWQMIKAKAGEIKNQVMEGIRNWVVTNVIKQGIIKLLSFLNPAGAIVQAILAIYNTIMFFVDNWQRIVDFVKSVFDSLANIAMGRLSAAASFIERALGMTIPIIMNFLSRLMGLSGIGKAVSKVITKIRKPIDKIVNKVIDKIVKMSGKLLKKSKSVANKVKDKLYGWLKLKKNFTDPAGKSHSLIFQGSAPNAQLIVRSAPKAIPAFIAEAKNAHKNNSVKLNKVSQIESFYTDIASQQRLSQRNKKDEAKQKQVGDKVNELMGKINKLLPQVFPDSDWGDQSNPLFIDWPKRASINYDTLYFGPKTNKWISQESLKAAKQSTAEKNKIKNKLSKKEREAWADNNNVIEDYKPHQLEALPDGGAILGLSSEWHVYKGKKFVLKAGKTTGGGQLNKILKKYGFSPSKENKGKGLDADHVIEMQLGGKNLMRNLWPLSAPENRSSGSIISSIKLKNKKKNEDIKISEVKSEAQKRPIWVEINKLKAKS